MIKEIHTYKVISPIVLVFLLLADIGYGQHAFQVLFKNPKDERVLDICENPAGCFYSVGYTGNNAAPQDYRGLIYKIRSESDTMSRYISFHDTVARFFKIVAQTDNSFLVLGSISNPPDYHERFLVLKIDSNLNIQFRKEFLIDDYDHFYDINYFEGPTNTIWVFCNLGILANGQYDVFFSKFNADGDTLECKYFLPYNPTSNSCLFNLDSSRLWMFGRGFDYNGVGQRAIFDTNFVFNSVQWIDPLVVPNINARWITDSTLVLIGNYFVLFSSPEDHNIGISIVDTMLNLIDINYFGSVDTMDDPGSTRCLDFIDPNRIFYVGTHNANFDPFSSEPSWIMTGMVDMNLDPEYEFFYGGDAYYLPCNILATQDGGSILAATRFDYLTQSFERDVLFLKLDDTGSITGLETPNSGNNKTLVSVSPNPGTNMVKIETNLQEFQFEIFTIQGQLIQVGYSPCRSLLINTDCIPSGQYLFRIKSKSKTKDIVIKWIKTN